MPRTAAEKIASDGKTRIKTKVTFTDFRPKRVHALPKDEERLELGTIIGVATGIKEGKMPDGITTYEGLSGNFELTPNDDTPIRSGICFMPEGFMEPILEQLRDEVDNEGVIVRDGASSVRFAFTVSVFKADNPAGYSWEATPLIEVAENDPLSELRMLTQAPAVAEIEGSRIKGAKETA